LSKYIKLLTNVFYRSEVFCQEHLYRGFDFFETGQDDFKLKLILVVFIIIESRNRELMIFFTSAVKYLTLYYLKFKQISNQ